MAGVFGTALDAITYAGIDTANDMLTVCDANGDNAGTGPEDKRIAAIEFIKRSIASGDVGWMSTLGIASVDHATTDLDRFMVWDASGPSFKLMTASDLLNKTLAGTSVAGLTQINSIIGVLDEDYIPVFDTSTPGWKRLPASELLNSLYFLYGGAFSYTPQNIPAANSGSRFTNAGMGALLVVNLPVTSPRMRYSFARVANYPVRLVPNGTGTIGAGGVGKYLEITTRGAVDLECFVSNAWEVVGGSSVYSFEP